MSVIAARVRSALIGATLASLPLATASAQKALVYCPVAIDATGCSAIVAALSGVFPAGVDGGFDGTGGTIDLASADLAGYGVAVIPSLADGGNVTPYALLRDPTIAARIKAAFPGRSAVWSGTPDRGSTNRAAKDGLIRNLASWAAADAAGARAPGLVVLQDNSDDLTSRYGWLSGISAFTLTADTTFESYSNVEVVTATGRTILTNSSGLQIGYANMASFGLVAGGEPGVLNNDATGGRSGRPVLLTAAGEPGAGIATIRTDREDYAPGDTVTITGSGWEPGETVFMMLHEDPVVHGDRTLTATADEQGHIFNNSFVPEEHDLGVRFVVTATGQTSGRTAQTTFTDNRSIIAATVNGGAAVTVAPGASITASVKVVTTTAGGGGENWFSTSYRIATTPPGTTTCVDTPDHTTVDTLTESFSVTAPAAPGVYNAYFIAWRTAGCGNNASNTFLLPNAVTVTAATNLAFTTTPFTVTFNQCSPQITVQTQNSTGIATNPSSNTTVNLASSSGGGAFYSNSTCTTLISSVTILTTGNSASFFYKDANVGGPTLTASATGFTSATQTETITQAPTATSVASSLNPSVYGNSVTFTATVNSAVSGIISGTVDFKDGATTIGSAPLSCALSCTASLATSILNVAGSPHSIRAQYLGNLNFAGSTSSALSQAVTPRPVTVTADAKTKVYGAADPALTYAITSGSLVAGDAFTGSLTRVPGEAIGTYAIQQGNLALGTNYTLTFVGANLTITTRPLTVTATAANKVYDGTTAASVTLADDRIAGDVLTVSYTTASFADKQAGNGKQVTVSGISIGGPAAGNYALANTTALATANITPRPLTVTATGVDKEYDGTTAATVTLSDDRLSGDIFTVNYTATFANKQAGSGKTVTVSGLSLTGADAGNYSVGGAVSTTASITPKSLTVTATGVDKVYDGTTTATVTLSDDRIPGDVFTAAYTAATFADKQVGTAKPISVTGISISGADAGNYSLASTTANANANITPVALTGHITAHNKEYDGTTAAAIATRTLGPGVIAGDDVILTGGTATFANKNVGTGKTVTATGLSLSGADAGNYTVNSSATTTADITPKPLTITATGVNKEYDGNTAATVTLSDDRVPGDLLTTSYAAAAFANKNAGTGKPVSVSGISISGLDATNYTLTGTTASTTADITPKPLATSITADNKVYDGTTNATIATRTLGAGVIAGDDVTLTGGTATFADKNAGTGKTVTATGLTLSGADAGNYSITGSATTTADITPRTLTVTAAGINKVYDATTAATVTLSDDRIAGDDVSTSYAAASFADKNAGTGKPVSVTGISISGGADAGNYSLGNTTASTTANITPRPLDSNLTADNKVYDGTTSATILTRTLTGVLGTDDVSLTGGTASFANKNVGNGKTVTATGLTLSGGDAGNYSITGSATTTANITPRTLTVTATGISKVYDATAAATVTLSDDRVSGDDVSTSYTSASFADKNAGTGKPVSVSGISISGGADAGNYVLGNTTASTTANITPLAISSHITADNKVYDGTTDATILTRTLTGVLGSDDVALTGGAATFADKNAGVGKTVTATGLTLSGGDADNYSITGAAMTTADITPRPITVTAHGKTKVYGDPDPALTYAVTTGMVVAGDAFAGALSRASGEDVGSYAIQQGSLTLGPNYTMGFVGASLAITPAPLAVKANSKVKTYADAFPVLDGSIVGIKNGDNISAVYAAGSGGSYNALTPAGVYAGVIVPTLVDPDGRQSNYTVTITNGTLTVLRSTPGYSNLASPTIVFGATSTTLSGKLSYQGAGSTGVLVFPGGNVSITVNGNTQTAAISSANGNFSVVFATGSLPANGPGHMITYSYSGSDANFNPASDNSMRLKVLYNTAVGHQFLQPINPNLTTGNRSSFKIGSTIPAKFELYMPDGLTKISSAVATISIVKISNSSDTPINEEIITIPPDEGTTFKVSSGQYHYNIGTKGWTPGTYRITANLDDGSKVTADVDGRSK